MKPFTREDIEKACEIIELGRDRAIELFLACNHPTDEEHEKYEEKYGECWPETLEVSDWSRVKNDDFSVLLFHIEGCKCPYGASRAELMMSNKEWEVHIKTERDEVLKCRADAIEAKAYREQKELDIVKAIDLEELARIQKKYGLKS